MQINTPLTFSLHGNEPVSLVLQKQAPSASLTKDTALKQLKAAPNFKEQIHPQSKPNIRSRSRSQNGIWNSITKFFNRRFSAITQTEQQESQEIKLLIGKVEQNLNKISKLAKTASLTEQSLKRTLPNDQSVKSSGGYLDEMRALFKKVEENFKTLKKQENTIFELADEHSTFDDLPYLFQKVEKNVEYLKARLEVAEKLFDLEVAVKDYYLQETWDQFTKVGDQRKALTQCLREVLTQNFAFKEDLGAQKYLQKPTWETSDIYEVVKHSFPGLRGQIERLWDASLEVQQRRVHNLDQQVKNLKVLSSKYTQLSKRINDLEKSTYDKSLNSRIYRLFHGKTSLKKQVQNTLAEQIKVYQTIQEKGKFNPKELDWLNTMIKLNLDKHHLKENIETILHETSSLEARHTMSVQMSKLLRHLEFHHVHYSSLKENTDLQFFDFPKLKKMIHSDIQELAMNIQNWQFQSSKLPHNFTKMDLLDQLKIVISLSFPTLQQRNAAIFNLIEEEKLHAELNQAIKDRTLTTTSTLDADPSEAEIVVEKKVQPLEDQRTPKISPVVAQKITSKTPAPLPKTKIRKETEKKESLTSPISSPPKSKTEDVKQKKGQCLQNQVTGKISPVVVQNVKSKTAPLPKAEEFEKRKSLTSQVFPTVFKKTESNKAKEVEQEKAQHSENKVEPKTSPLNDLKAASPVSKKESNLLNRSTSLKAPLSQPMTDIRPPEEPKEKPSLVSQIQKGITLKKVSSDKTPARSEEPKEKPSLLSQIHQGITLKKVSSDKTPAPSSKPKYEELLKKIESKELKVKEIKREDFAQLSLLEQTGLILAERRLSLKASSDDEQSDFNWDD